MYIERLSFISKIVASRAKKLTPMPIKNSKIAVKSNSLEIALKCG